ncbi:hypothetical protein GCM10009691_13160 [Brevibacterium picturae]|uniref:Uncharacterized protein n=1 Tax=Brevibacterium picturae TaxID=260553 RepID=A0ABP4M8S9_9MICO
MGRWNHLGEGTEIHCTAHRHGRMDTELTRLVAGRDHHPSPTATTDDDGAAEKFRAAQELHRDEERIHVEVKHRGTSIVRPETTQIATGTCQLFTTHRAPMCLRLPLSAPVAQSG